MEFEGMAPQEAAAAIVEAMAVDIMQRGIDGISLRWIEDSEARIAAALRHFEERESSSYKEGYDAAEAVYMRATSESNIPNLQRDVRQFMAIAGQAIPERPQWPDQETMDLRVRLESEEFTERLRDSGYEVHLRISATEWYGNEPANWRNVFAYDADHRAPRSLPKSADALIDLLYVTIGSLLAMGIDMWPLWAEVQRANMAKLGGTVVDGKLLKPEGWQPPDIEGLLRKQGWEGQDGR